MQAVLNLFILFFSFLAGFSGIVGGIILLINGDWSLVFTLVIGAGIAPFIMSFAMMPLFVLAGPGTILIEKGYKFLGEIFLWLSSIYLGLVFGLWSSYVLIYVFENTSSLWGALFASFGTAISPIIFMTSKNPIQTEEDMVANMSANLSAEISLFSMIVYALFYGGDFYDFFIIYLICFAIISGISALAMNLLFNQN